MVSSSHGRANFFKRVFYPKSLGKIFFPIFLIALISSLAFSNIFHSELVSAATFTWTQTSWAGGTSGGTYPVHPTNQSGWTKYASKDTSTVVSGSGITMTGEQSLTQTTDTDFNLGTNDVTTVTGSGASGSITLPIGGGATIAVDASSQYGTVDSNATSISWSHTATGSNLILIVDAGTYSGATVSSVTYNGVALTHIVSAVNGPASELWYLLNPPTGSHTIAITYSSAALRAWGAAITLTGVHQETPIEVSGSATGSTPTTLSVTKTTSIGGDWSIDAWAAGGGVVNAQSGQTVRQSKSGSFYVAAMLTSGPHAAGSNTDSTSVDSVGPGNSEAMATAWISPAITGTYTSAVLDTGSASSTFTTLTDTVSTPVGTTLTVDVRAGDTASPDGTWTSWQTGVVSGASIASLGTHRYVQYRANLGRTTTAVTPSIDDISIKYAVMSSTLISSAYDSSDSNNAIASFQWTASSTPGSVAFQLRTAPDSGGAPGTFTGWMGPDGTSATYFTDSSGGDAIPATLRDGLSDQWFQYKVFLTLADVSQTPSISSVSVRYVVNIAPDFDANYPSTAAGGVSAVQNADGTVSVSYSVRDQDTGSGSITPGYVTPSFEYSFNDGSTWTAIASSTLGATAWTNKVVDASNYTTYTATWFASSSVPNIFHSNAKVRVTVNDNEGAHNITRQASAAFALDTNAPAVSAYVLNVGSGTITLNIADDSNILYRLSNNADMTSDGVNATSGQWQSVGSTSFSQAISWVFTGSSPDVYLQVKDIVSNQAAFSATAPGAPQSYQLKDVSNVAAGDFKEFIFWQVYSSGAGTTFASYKLQRSADAGASYSTISTITDQDLNYYLDSTVNGSTTYTYRVQTTDSDGDTSAFTPAVSDLPNGQGGTDVTAPVITSVTVSETQSTWVTLTWTTDELSNSIVQYSADPDTSFGTAVTVNTMVTSHSVTITGLTPNTLYHMRVRSADILNNAATDANGGGGYSVTTTNGPIISNVTTPAIGDQTASVSWDTNIDSSSIVVYADNAALSNPQQAGTSGLVGGASSTVVFQHRVDLTGLTAGRTYYYYVQSTDADSNATTDNNSGNYYTFHTSQDVNGPTISNVSTPIVGSVAAVIVWQTSELSTSQVAYGNSSTSLSSLTTLDSTLSIYHIATITGLTEQTEYFFAVHSKDQADNETVAEVSSFTTAQSTDVLIAAALSASTGGGGGGSYYLTDTTPPSITELAVKDIGPFDATVTWRTNKLVRSFVELTDGKGNVTTFGSANPSEKTSIHLTNLKLGQMYSYVAKSVDTSGNFSAATPSTFQTTFVVEQNDETQISDVTDLQDKLSDVIESSLPSLLPPTISDIAISDITESSAKITWNTNIKGSSLVAIADKGQYHPDTDKPYPLEQSGQEEALKSHTVTVQDLEPNTLYHYQVRTKTLVGTLGKGPDKTFSTKAGKIKPFISGLTSTSFIVSWTTDQPTTSVVEYKNKATGAVNRKSDNTMTTKHEVTIANISQGASYEVTASGANSDGNILSGESLPVTVTRDVSAPVLSNFKVESFMVPGRADRIQTVVSWQTNEPADSVVEYNEGVGNSKKGFENRYEDLKDLTVTHTVALLNLKPETVYELQVTSADQFGNKTVFGPRTVITPKQAQSIIDVIFSNFNETFKFIKNINP